METKGTTISSIHRFPSSNPSLRVSHLPQPEEFHPDASQLPPPAPDPVEPPAPAKPGWRTVHKRAERKERALAKLAAPEPVPAPAPAPPKPGLPAWAQWRRTCRSLYQSVLCCAVAYM